MTEREIQQHNREEMRAKSFRNTEPVVPPPPPTHPKKKEPNLFFLFFFFFFLLLFSFASLETFAQDVLLGIFRGRNPGIHSSYYSPINKLADK